MLRGRCRLPRTLNLSWGWRSCVGWHRDDELLFGRCGEAKLIVSVSFGSTAVFRWNGKSCSDNEAHLCWLDHGDILVKDGQCQDEFLPRTDPGREQEWINVTFRWVKQHVSSCPLFRTGVACCLASCAQGLSAPVTGDCVFCWPPCYVQNLGYFGVPHTGHALWAWFGWSITFITSWENAWQLIKLANIFGRLVEVSFFGAMYASLGGTAQSPWL